MKDYSYYWLDCLHSGSRVICNPPVLDTDDDYIILCAENRLDEFKRVLEGDGFVLGGSGVQHQGNESKFWSYKKSSDDEGIINFIITLDEKWFDNSIKATSLARALNLKSKEDRITLFEAIREGNWPDVGDLIV